MDRAAVAAASLVLARAFDADPLFRWAVPDDARRARALPRVFAGSLRHCGREGGGHGVPPGGRGRVHVSPDGAAVLGWVDGTRLRVGARDVLAAGLWAAPLALGVTATRRLQRHEAIRERVLREEAPAGWAYLWVVGVDPDRQGRGAGGALIRTALAAMADGHRACLLKTEQPANVARYAHLGFETVATVDDGSGPPSWVMRRDL